MVIMAIDQSLNRVAMKRVHDDQLLSILTDFNYDIDSLCSHLKIKGDQIYITLPDKNEKSDKVRKNEKNEQVP